MEQGGQEGQEAHGKAQGRSQSVVQQGVVQGMVQGTGRVAERECLDATLLSPLAAGNPGCMACNCSLFPVCWWL